MIKANYSRILCVSLAVVLFSGSAVFQRPSATVQVTLPSSQFVPNAENCPAQARTVEEVLSIVGASPNVSLAFGTPATTAVTSGAITDDDLINSAIGAVRNIHDCLQAIDELPDARLRLLSHFSESAIQTLFAQNLTPPEAIFAETRYGGTAAYQVLGVESLADERIAVDVRRTFGVASPVLTIIFTETWYFTLDSDRPLLDDLIERAPPEFIDENPDIKG